MFPMTATNRATALAVGKRIGIELVEADVLPEDKAAGVRKFLGEGRPRRILLVESTYGVCPAA
jgi:cation transport ATPase